MLSSFLSPWHTRRRPEQVRASWVDRVADLRPTAMVGAHGPLISGRGDRRDAFERARRAARAPPDPPARTSRPRRPDHPARRAERVAPSCAALARLPRRNASTRRRSAYAQRAVKDEAAGRCSTSACSVLSAPSGAENRSRLGGPRQRAVLARLALVAGQVVTVDRLIDDVWAGEPPATAVNTLQSYVSLLRRALGGAERLPREGTGLRCSPSIGPSSTPPASRTASRRRGQLLDADPRRALDELDVALGEWRGPVLADVADEEWARAAAVRWDEMRLGALEARFDALLALGRHTEAIGELERAIDEHPFREGFTERVMVALYRSGRQTEALRAFSRTREVLADELGLDPSPGSIALQTSILNHDPTLAAPGTARSAPQPRRAGRRRGRPPTGRPRRPRRCRFPARSCAPPPSRSSVARRRSPTSATMWEETLRGRAAVRPRHRRARRRQVEPRRPLRRGDARRGSDRAVGPGDAATPSCRSSRWCRRCGRCCAPCRRRRASGSPRERGTLATLLPELQQLVPDVEVTRPDPTVERYLLFETVAELLQSGVEPPSAARRARRSALGRCPVVADDRARDAARAPGRVMMLGTARSTSDDANADLDQMATDLARVGVLRRIALDGLDTSDVSELLRAARSRRGGSRRAARRHRRERVLRHRDHRPCRQRRGAVRRPTRLGDRDGGHPPRPARPRRGQRRRRRCGRRADRHAARARCRCPISTPTASSTPPMRRSSPACCATTARADSHFPMH